STRLHYLYVSCAILFFSSTTLILLFLLSLSLFFFNHPPTTAIYTLSLHDALPILPFAPMTPTFQPSMILTLVSSKIVRPPMRYVDRKSTRLNSSHLVISYAVFCLKKKKKKKKKN